MYKNDSDIKFKTRLKGCFIERVNSYQVRKCWPTLKKMVLAKFYLYLQDQFLEIKIFV